MKILLTHRFFWPDTAPYATFLRAIGEELAEGGHDVHTFSSVNSYRDSDSDKPSLRYEALGSLNVRRIWVFPSEKSFILKRLANVIIYCVGLFFEVLRLRPDVVTASTFPPVIAAWTASLASQMIGARFVYHIQDIHPEISIYSGGRLGRGLPMKILRALDNQTLRRSSAIVVLSTDMANTLRDRGLGELPLHVINNLSLDVSSSQTLGPPAEFRKSEGRRRVIFAGNLGRFQRLPLLANGVSRLFSRYPDLELCFLGDGTALPELKANWGGHPQVLFANYMPFEQARLLIEEADVGLVSLSPGVYKVAYPSKVLTYAGLGIPILALVEPESELANALKSGGIGAVPAEDTPTAIASELEFLLNREVEHNVVRNWHDETAGSSQILTRWRELIDGLGR